MAVARRPMRPSLVIDVVALGLLAAAMVELVVLAVTLGSAWSMVLAATAVAAVVAGLVVAARRVAFEDAERPGGSSVGAAFVDLVRRTRLVWAALSGYELALLAGIALHDATVAIAVTAGLLTTATAMWRREGVERQVFVESTCVAFFAVVVGLGVVAVVGPTGEAATAAPWALYVFGMVTWAIASAVRRRQLT